MFIGHFGLGFGAKALASRTSLGTLLLAAQFLDLLWPSLLLLGIEQVRVDPGATRVTPLDFVQYPVSHSLAAVLIWALGLALVHFSMQRTRRGAIVVGVLVVSHWLLDALVHRADLPLYPGGPLIGLGLWSSLPATLVLELPIFALGLWLYTHATRTLDAAGRWSLWSLVACLAAIYIANLFGPPPPSVAAIAWAGQLQWLLVAWGYWIDRHRAPV